MACIDVDAQTNLAATNATAAGRRATTAATWITRALAAPRPTTATAGMYLLMFVAHLC
jgi:hypothetical protein